MKTFFAILLFPLLAHSAEKPNFLIIFTDDHGYGDVSTYHKSDCQTPNIDKLAAEGMLFANLRANCTVCSPSRAALLTGKYADRVGVPGVIRTEKENSWGYFDPAVPTLANELKDAGYHTALIGKWHLGLEPENHPNERGFDHFHGFLGDMMDSYTTHLRGGKNFMRLNSETITPKGHATDIFADWAADYFKERAAKKDKPFFLYLAFNAPHFPIQPPAEWLEKVKKRSPDLDPKRAMNVAFVEHLDDRIGHVLAALKESGFENNTVVVFSADNGGHLGSAQNNEPWRGGKQSHYDGGLRVPFAARWPGHIASGSSTNHVGLVFDIFPTFLEIAGVNLSDDLDASSLLPIFQGSAQANVKPLYFVRREGGSDYQGNAYHAVIEGDWKLLQNNAASPFELYNITEDPQETTNLADKNPKEFERLAKILREKIQQGGRTPWRKP